MGRVELRSRRRDAVTPWMAWGGAVAGFLAWGCGFDQRWVRFFCGGRMPPRLGQGPRFAWRFTKSWGHPVPTKSPTPSMPPPTTEGRRGGQERGLPRYARPPGSLRLAISAALRFSCPHRNKTRRSRQTLPHRESISQVFDHHSTRGSSSLLGFQAAVPRSFHDADKSVHAPVCHGASLRLAATRGVGSCFQAAAPRSFHDAGKSAHAPVCHGASLRLAATRGVGSCFQAAAPRSFHDAGKSAHAPVCHGASLRLAATRGVGSCFQAAAPRSSHDAGKSVHAPVCHGDFGDCTRDQAQTPRFAASRLSANQQRGTGNAEP